MRQKLPFFPLLLSTLSSIQALAWGDLGHQAVGELAERRLSPEAKRMVTAILGAEPLAVAAVFPDLVRSDARFKAFAPYHFIEIPDGMRYESMPRALVAEKNADTIISQVPAILADPAVGRERKALLLRYLVHVVGDVHQPLHVGNGFDMGANLCDIYWKDPQTGFVEHTNLHTVWDERLIDIVKDRYRRSSDVGTAKRYFSYPELLESVLLEQPAKDEAAAIAAAPVAQWYHESQNARAALYPDTDPVASPMERNYCKYVDPNTHKVVNGAFKESKIPSLGLPYAKQQLVVLKRQIFAGGVRLGALLNKIAGDFKGNAVENLSFDEILEAGKLKNPK